MNSKEKIYISLPITGHDLQEVRWCAEKAKKELENRGWEAVTPFDVCDETDKPYAYYIGKDIEALLGCDAIYMCRGWQGSKGCNAELHVAVVYGKEIFHEIEM